MAPPGMTGLRVTEIEEKGKVVGLGLPAEE